MSTRTDHFIDALRQLEESGDGSALESLFTEGAELARPNLSHDETASDPASFWKAYRDQFDSIRSEFGRVDDSGDTAVLEWRSSGRLAAGREIEYAGVSLLTYDGDAVSRFTTYYDTAAFLEPTGS